ncbi:MAG: xylan 1,4-beta-xylosidase [Lachnospiraceae bacterium]|nr:xylan 1,4-beta-xylosidase [Lachnospiraceae bacterium]MBR3835059.1 xylan 1,4-beta-xylosidase [Lachnospiraceae bacterium]
MKKEERFVETYSQGTVSAIKIFVDKETGVNYVFHHQGNAGGMTVLLDKDGKPVVTKVEDN